LIFIARFNSGDRRLISNVLEMLVGLGGFWLR
jgi:hypothetical protein